MNYRALTVAFALTAAMSTSTWSRSSPPDAIYYNGRIATVDASSSVAEALAVTGDRFVAVGRTADVRALAGPATRLVDLEGRAVVPGLIDNHNHQYHVALLTERGIDLREVPSLEALLGRLREAAAREPEGRTLFTTTGWDAASFPEQRAPTRDELDAVTRRHPLVVYASRGRVHLNSAALAVLGVTRGTTVVERVTAGTDAAGEPDGVLTGSPAAVLNLMRRVVPPPRLEEAKAIIRTVQARQHAMGLTGIRELQLHPDAMRAYYELWRDGALTLRTSVGLEVNAGEEAHLERMLDAWGVGAGFGDEWLRLDCIAEYNPGEVMREPYLDRGGNGELRLPLERFRDAILAINRAGWRPSIHVSGDRTLDHVLDAYEAADRERSIKDRRWVVEHIPIVHPDQMARMKRLGVVVSAQFQPYRNARELLHRLGPARTERAVPMRELLDHGLVVSGGSDWPGAPNNPFVNIAYYVTRNTETMGQVGAAQKISRQEALRVMTMNNALVTFEERIKGSIEPGKLADFVVLSDDPLTVPEDRLAGITAVATYVGGRKVYDAARTRERKAIQN